MWSAGIACFTESPDMKSVIKKVAVHPCIIAVYIGLSLMIFQEPLAALHTTVLAACGPQVGTVADVILTALDKGTKTAGGCTTGLTMVLIGMMMSGMPAGSTSAILAAKYGCDYTFATKCIVVSTVLSMVTIPIWGTVMG